jgi:hypothetical protein
MTSMIILIGIAALGWLIAVGVVYAAMREAEQTQAEIDALKADKIEFLSEPVAYYYQATAADTIEVYADYGLNTALVKSFTGEYDYIVICAEELVEKLNEKI